MIFVMKKRRISIILFIGIFLFSIPLNSQTKPFVKVGLNYGTINQQWWTYLDSIEYGKPLIRPIIGIGADIELSDNWFIRQELMFQVKGQGTIRPDVRSSFLTSNPDILRFISFPISIHGRLFSEFFLGLGYQPSIYLSGADNYYAKENWGGWIHSGIVQINYFHKEKLELGLEYDHDFTLYYCPDCDIRFYTYRFYAAYHL